MRILFPTKNATQVLRKVSMTPAVSQAYTYTFTSMLIYEQYAIYAIFTQSLGHRATPSICNHSLPPPLSIPLLHHPQVQLQTELCFYLFHYKNMLFANSFSLLTPPLSEKSLQSFAVFLF